jgi:hypothetical protein
MMTEAVGAKVPQKKEVVGAPRERSERTSRRFLARERRMLASVVGAPRERSERTSRRFLARERRMLASVVGAPRERRRRCRLLPLARRMRLASHDGAPLPLATACCRSLAQCGSLLRSLFALTLRRISMLWTSSM